MILWQIACDVPSFVTARIKASDKWSVLPEKKKNSNKISHSWSIPSLSLSLSPSCSLFIDLSTCLQICFCVSTPWDLSSKLGPISPLSLFPACLLPVPWALAHSSQADLRGSITVQEMKLFHSSPLLLSSRSWWGPLLLQRHVGRDVSCVRSSSLLTCVWPFVPAAEGAAAFSIKWLVIWGPRGVELS